MTVIEKEKMTLEVNLEKTKEYYQNRSLLSGVVMKNFAMQVAEAAPKVREYLDEFGVDITKPDEFCSSWQDGKGKIHYNVAYTVVGNIEKVKHNEIILQDRTNIHIVLEKGYIPNEQKEAYFGFTVYNIELPWILEEEYPSEEIQQNEKTEEKKSLLDKMLDFLIR